MERSKKKLETTLRNTKDELSNLQERLQSLQIGSLFFLY
jgi:hypothetical protein